MLHDYGGRAMRSIASTYRRPLPILAVMLAAFIIAAVSCGFVGVSSAHAATDWTGGSYGPFNPVPMPGGFAAPNTPIQIYAQDDTYPIAGVRTETDAMIAAGFPLVRVELDGGHYDDAGAIENGHAVPGTSADIATYLFPYLDAGWTAP